MDKYKLGTSIREKHYLYPGFQITTAIVENTREETPYLYIVGDRIFEENLEQYNSDVYNIIRYLNHQFKVFGDL